MKIAALVVAAGRGKRAGLGLPKQYRRLNGVPVLTRTMTALLESGRIDLVAAVIHPDDEALYRAAAPRDERVLPPIQGGAERALSVRAGLEALSGHAPDLALIHDAARPFVTLEIIDGVIDALATHDGAIAAAPVVDALLRAEDGLHAGTLPRTGVWAAQTPQGFRFPGILAAHRANPDPMAADDAEVARAAGMSVAVFESNPENSKLTSARDFERAEKRGRMREFRTGQGYDVHAFTEGKSVILCGIPVPHGRALKGHSDADVAMHALTDAIFGAMAEGDIGRWFPPSDPQWKGAPSRIFLEKAMERVRERGGALVNADVTIICERPKIGPHAEEMIAALSDIMNVERGRISVKATTSEGLGFTGREEGIAAMAVATVAFS